MRLASTDGISPVDETDALKYLSLVGVDCQDIDKPDSALMIKAKNQAKTITTYLEDFGFTTKEVAIILGRQPELLTKDMDEIKKRFEMLNALGLYPEDIVKIVCVNRTLMITDLDIIEGQIRNMRLLMGASTSWICSMLKYKPLVFTNLDPSETGTNIVMVKDLLCEHGSAYPEKVLREIMRSDYRLYRVSEEKIKRTVDYLGTQGISGTNLVYVIKKCANVFQMTPEDLEARLENLADRLSLDEAEVNKFVLYFPRAWGMNETNLNKHIDFIYSVGLTSADIVKHPYLLWMSIRTLETRFWEQKKMGLFAMPKLRSLAIPRMFLSEKMFRYQMDRITEEKAHAKRKKKALSQAKEQ